VIGSSATYTCNYPGTRVEYSATEVTTTPFPKNYVHAPDLGPFSRAAFAITPPVSGGAAP
jgi:hypothetical protein